MEDASVVNLVLNVILALLLIISEMLGWSNCTPNAISQLFLCLPKKDAHPDEQVPLHNDTAAIPTVVSVI